MARKAVVPVQAPVEDLGPGAVSEVAAENVEPEALTVEPEAVTIDISVPVPEDEPEVEPGVEPSPAEVVGTAELVPEEAAAPVAPVPTRVDALRALVAAGRWSGNELLLAGVGLSDADALEEVGLVIVRRGVAGTIVRAV